MEPESVVKVVFTRPERATVGPPLVGRKSVVLIMPVIQYAWTFFYLRLVEIDPLEHGIEVGPAYAEAVPVTSPMTGALESVSGGTPRLALVEPPPKNEHGEPDPVG